MSGIYTQKKPSASECTMNVDICNRKAGVWMVCCKTVNYFIMSHVSIRRPASFLVPQLLTYHGCYSCNNYCSLCPFVFPIVAWQNISCAAILLIWKYQQASSITASVSTTPFWTSFGYHTLIYQLQHVTAEWIFFVCLFVCFQSTAPFLHIAALATVTAISWLVAGYVIRRQRSSKS